MSRHTPGPWEWREGRGGTSLRHLKGADDSMILWFGDSASYYPSEGTEPDEADARLIAAAPTLLRELKHLVALLEPLEQDGSLNVPGLATLNGARNAIKEAEGES